MKEKREAEETHTHKLYLGWGRGRGVLVLYCHIFYINYYATNSHSIALQKAREITDF